MLMFIFSGSGMCNVLMVFVVVDVNVGIEMGKKCDGYGMICVL